MSDVYTTPVPRHSALLTIDMQNDFTLADGPALIPGTEEVVPAIEAALQDFRKAGRPIIHVIRLYNVDGTNVDNCRRSLIESGAAIALPGSHGAELIDALKLEPSQRLDARRLFAGEIQEIGPNEWAMYKPRWSAFFATQLDANLRKLGVDTIVVTGCNFPNCPRSTIFDASNRDYRIVIVSDAISGLYGKALEELENIGVATMLSQEVAEWLRSRPERLVKI